MLLYVREKTLFTTYCIGSEYGAEGALISTPYIKRIKLFFSNTERTFCCFNIYRVYDKSLSIFKATVRFLFLKRF